MTKIDIYAVIPGVGEQTWTIWTADVRKECAKIQACLKEHKLYQTDNVIMSAEMMINPKYITLVAVDDHVDSWAYTKAEVDAGADKNKKENN